MYFYFNSKRYAVFRQEAINYQRRKWRGRALLLPGIPLWAMAGLCLFFITAILIFIVAGTYTRRVNVMGEVSSFPRAANVYSSIQGVVVRKFVTEGEKIKAGTPIYQIDVSKRTSSGVISNNRLRDIDNQLEHITQIINRLNCSKKATLDMLEKQKSQYTDAFRRSTDIVQHAREGLRFMKENMNNYRDYQTKGLINKEQLSNQVALYYQHQNSLLALSSQNEQNALQITTLESQIQIQAAAIDNQIYHMKLQQYELKKERVNNESEGMIVVCALTDGCIDSLSVTVGQMVNAGDSLFQIIPEQISHYSLVFWVPNGAIPYIAIGDPVKIRYEAFPAEKFGQFSGTVSVISRTPASSQEMMTYQGAQKAALTASAPYYKVVVKPQKLTIAYAGKYLGLENGMQVQTTFFLEKRKVYQWMLAPFYDMKQSVTGPIYE